MSQIASAFEALKPQNGSAYLFDRALVIVALGYFCGLEQWMIQNAHASDYDPERGTLTTSARGKMLKFLIPEFVRPAMGRVARRRRGRLIAPPDWQASLNVASRALGCGTWELCAMTRRAGITHAAAINGIETAMVLGRCSPRRLKQLIDWSQVPADSPALVIDCEQVVLHPRRSIGDDKEVPLR